MSTSRIDVPRIGRSSERFDFATEHPIGWYVVAFSSELPAGQIVRMRYFGRDLIVYRGESGAPYVADAYCPHLGAHLGHGGAIEGETVRCPFHRWRFEGRGGKCVEIPYADKVPPRARLDTFPTREINGTVVVFHDPNRTSAEAWPLPELEETGWTPQRTVHWRNLRTHPQEIFENTVDTAHIAPVHDGRRATIVGKPRFHREKMEVDIQFQAPGDIVGMPGVLNDVHLHVELLGLGWVVVQTHVTNAGVRARQRIHATPVDHESVDIRAVVQVREGDDPAFTDEVARLFHQAYVEDFAKDFPIWENKRYLPRPLLAKGDGPIGAYRKWCTQFYGQPRGERSEPGSIASMDWISPIRERLSGVLASLSSPVRSSAPEPTGNGSGSTSRQERRVASTEEYYATLPDRFVPAAAAGVEAVFQWDLGGDQLFFAEVRDGTLRAARGRHASPTVTLRIDAPDFLKVVNGELDGVTTFATGRGKVTGSLPMAMKMRSIFPA